MYNLMYTSDNISQVIDVYMAAYFPKISREFGRFGVQFSPEVRYFPLKNYE